MMIIRNLQRYDVYLCYVSKQTSIRSINHSRGQLGN